MVRTCVACCVLVLIGLARANRSAPRNDAKMEMDKTKREALLDKTVRGWQKGLSSKKKEERKKTLLSMLPTDGEIQHLFPKHSDKLVPIMKKARVQIGNQADEIAKDFIRCGPIKKITMTDVRASRGTLLKRYRPVLSMIPNDVSVYEIDVQAEKLAFDVIALVLVKGHGVGSQACRAFLRLSTRRESELERRST